MNIPEIKNVIDKSQTGLSWIFKKRKKMASCFRIVFIFQFDQSDIFQKQSDYQFKKERLLIVYSQNWQIQEQETLNR